VPKCLIGKVGDMILTPGTSAKDQNWLFKIIETTLYLSACCGLESNSIIFNTILIHLKLAQEFFAN
jgi:hypothetical protein